MTDLAWLGIVVGVIAPAVIVTLRFVELPEKRDATHAGQMDALGAAVRFARKEIELRVHDE